MPREEGPVWLDCGRMDFARIMIESTPFTSISSCSSKAVFVVPLSSYRQCPYIVTFRQSVSLALSNHRILISLKSSYLRQLPISSPGFPPTVYEPSSYHALSAGEISHCAESPPRSLALKPCFFSHSMPHHCFSYLSILLQCKLPGSFLVGYLLDIHDPCDISDQVP